MQVLTREHCEELRDIAERTHSDVSIPVRADLLVQLTHLSIIYFSAERSMGQIRAAVALDAKAPRT